MNSGSRNDSQAQNRPSIGVLFECHNVYVRIYRHHDGSHYAGRCPRCGRRVRLIVTEGGSNARFFRVSK